MSDLSVIAENLSLAALEKGHGLKTLDGRINASCTLKGPSDQRQIDRLLVADGPSVGRFLSRKCPRRF